jgi:hypothetical protein
LGPPARGGRKPLSFHDVADILNHRQHEPLSTPLGLSLNGVSKLGQKMPLKTVSITLGCMFRKEIYRSPVRGTITLPQHETWQETFTLPDKGYTRTNITCPVCQQSFQVKVYSKSKARLRKLFFASCFFVIGACGIVFGMFAGTGKGYMGYGLAAPFGFFTLWQLVNAVRGRFDPSDIVCHAKGKVHRIFGGQKIIFPHE